MTAEPDAAVFAARPVPVRRAGIISATFAAAMLVALISLVGAAFFVLGARMTAERGAPPTPAHTSSAAGAAAPGEAQGQTVSAAITGPSPITAGPPSDIAGLAGRVAALEARQNRLLDAASEALAVAALSRAVDQPQPFAQTLSAFAGSLPSAGTATLTPLAVQGAPTRAELARSLDDLAARVSAEARTPAQGASLPARLAYALSRLVSIRQVDPAGSGPDAIVARAEIAANAGDIEGALSLLSRLPSSTNSVLASWRQAARRRVAIDRAVAGLQAEALADLAVARSAAP
jgi:hypothetical protein